MCIYITKSNYEDKMLLFCKYVRMHIFLKKFAAHRVTLQPRNGKVSKSYGARDWRILTFAESSCQTYVEDKFRTLDQ